MFSRLKILVAMQLTNKNMFKKMKGKNIVLYFILKTLGILASIVVGCGIFYLIKNIMFLKVDYSILLFVIGVTQILSIISSTNQLVDSLYLNKDNQILFTFPARHSEIFFSKLIAYYISEFIKNLYLLLPVFVGFAFITSGFSVLYILNMLILLVILPLFPVVIGAILSIPLMYIKKLIKMIPIIASILGLGLTGGIFYLIYFILDKLPKPLRILALYDVFIKNVNMFIENVNQFFLYYKNITNILFNGSVFDYLIILAIIVSLVLVCYFLAMPLFFKVVSHFSERTNKKIHTPKTVVKRSAFFSYLNKEIKSILRTPGKLFNNLSFILIFPCLLFVINYIFSAINTNSLGNSLIICFNILVALILATANNTNSATVITTEGAEFAVIKTAPSKTYKIAWAKISFNIASSVLAIILGGVVLVFMTHLSVLEVAMLVLSFIFIDVGHLLWSFQLDILNPKLKDYATTGNLNNNKNVAQSMLIGLLISIIMFAICTFFFLDSYSGGWARLISISAIFFVVRLFLFSINLKVYFKRIEY